MGWIKKEAKAFGSEFARQGSILLFGKAPKSKHRSPRKIPGAVKEFKRIQLWAKQHGFK